MIPRREKLGLVGLAIGSVNFVIGANLFILGSRGIWTLSFLAVGSVVSMIAAFMLIKIY